MKLSVLNNTSKLARMAMGLGSLLGVSALILGLNSQVIGGQSEGNVDRGENPVVGSLPCRIDPTLDLIFWEGQGLDDPGFMPAMYPATLGLCSDDIESDVVDADGTPYGVLDDAYDWNSMGLQQAGYMLIPRYRAASGKVTAWVWTPAGYMGGELCLQSSLVSGKTTLQQNAVEIPISALAQLAPSGHAATPFYLTVTPPANRPDLPEIDYQITVTQFGVRLKHF